MSHITIIIGSGSQEAASSSQSSAEGSVSYVPGHDMTWEEIGKEVEKIEKRITNLLE